MSDQKKELQFYRDGLKAAMRMSGETRDNLAVVPGGRDDDKIMMKESGNER